MADTTDAQKSDSVLIYDETSPVSKFDALPAEAREAITVGVQRILNTETAGKDINPSSPKRFSDMEKQMCEKFAGHPSLIEKFVGDYRQSIAAARERAAGGQLKK